MTHGKTLKWTLILLGSAAVTLLAGAACWIFMGSSRLERRLAALREVGQPVSLADLRQETVPPEANAATYLAEAREELAVMMRGIYAAEEAAKKGRASGEDASETSEEPLPESVLAATRAALAAHPRVVPLLEKAAACPAYSIAESLDPAADLDATLKGINDRMRDHRSVARLLAKYRFGCLMAEGNRDEAVKSCTTLLRLSRHLDKEPTMIGFLVSVACRGTAIDAANKALQSGPVSNDVLEALDRELAEHDVFQAWAGALATERASCVDQFRAAPAASRLALVGPYSDRQMEACLDEIEQFLDRARQPADSLISTSTPPAQGILASLLTPALKAAETAARRTEAMVRALRVLVALQRRAEPERPPAADLSDLGLPRRATLDPFTGKPLVVKKAQGGWLVYSLGENLADDGGSVEDNKDTGVTSPKANPWKDR